MDWRKRLRSSTFRIAGTYTGLFSLSVLVLFSVVYLATVRSIREQVENEIRAEISALATERSAEGLAAVAETIARRVDGDLSGARLLLQDASGRVVAGNLAAMMPVNGWIDLPPPEDPLTGRRHSEHVVHGKGRVFDDGWYLFVGRDSHPLRQLREIIVRGFLVCGLATIAVALLLALATGERAVRRLRAMSVTSNDIIRGDLSRRLAISPRQDEFDELARLVNAMLARIERLVEDLQQVSNDIAHDLRTPLTRLRQRLELAVLTERPGCAGDCPMAGEIAGAIADADRLLATFSAMLRIAQIDSGSRRAGFRAVDLSRLLQNLVETYLPVAEDAGHALHAELADGLGITGDAELLTQLFANLIENAIEHTPAGSRIEVTVRQNPEGACASVADDGPGIPEGQGAQVCKRFVRLETSRNTPGSGLGLSLVAAIADLHAASLEFADNRPGLRVTLRFPAGAAPGR
ncbi:MAG: HAMP domain-containing protein [Rhodospirillales bacterium]|nr:HAMP domain-containing protein [Rhodospirillales bacterium]